jgi:hypothetical protein
MAGPPPAMPADCCDGTPRWIVGPQSPIGNRRTAGRRSAYGSGEMSTSIIADILLSVVTSRLARLAFVVLALGVAVAGCALQPDWTRDDHGPSQARRQEVVGKIESGEIHEIGKYPEEIVLPATYADLSERGVVSARDGHIFFTTWVGFSPDPYCGYEYAADPDNLEPDPLGSGGGIAEPLGDGWYWICAR